MKSLPCDKVCVHGCDYVAEGDTEREIIQNMFFHAGNSHKEIFRDMYECDRQKITSIMHALIKTQ